jgi:hypothetical protein
MKLPDDTLIASEKVTRYLLQQRVEDDKSGFLAQPATLWKTRRDY